MLGVADEPPPDGTAAPADAATPPPRTQEGAHEGAGPRDPGGNDPSRRDGGQHPPRADASRPPRNREPRAHQDAQGPRHWTDAARGRRERDRLPEDRRDR